MRERLVRAEPIPLLPPPLRHHLPDRHGC